jgi:hypothetical protein
MRKLVCSTLRGARGFYGWLGRRTVEQSIAIGTWALAVATIALALATIWLVVDAKHASQRQLRAYVYINPGSAFHVGGKNTLQIYSVLGNSGQTPAINVERFVGLEVSPPKDNIASDSLMTREHGIAVLGPRGELMLVKNWKGNGRLNDEQTKSIRRSELMVYVFGKILFEDIFGDKWETHFCNAYFGDEGFYFPYDTETDFGYVNWQARPCENGNKVQKRS